METPLDRIAKDMFNITDKNKLLIIEIGDPDDFIYVMIDSLSEEELFQPHMRKWADDATKTAVWEVYKFIHINTVAPFGTFRTKIRKWKRVAV